MVWWAYVHMGALNESRVRLVFTTLDRNKSKHWDTEICRPEIHMTKMNDNIANCILKPTKG